MPWKAILKTNITSIDTLADYLKLSPSNREKLQRNHFPLNLPQRLASKMAKNNLNDPLFLQFVPLVQELNPFGIIDPVADLDYQKGPRLLQKYEGRALIITTGACAMHCRYCFRKNFPYNQTPRDYAPALSYLASHPAIHEVILSGGDPLSLSDRHLAGLIKSLEEIPHIKLLRFHTRFPIGIPERITPSLLSILSNTPLQIIFVVHINHPHELDCDVISALKKIQILGIPTLNQSVLLRGINDDLPTLKSLCLTLVSNAIMPYYMHQLDPVEGAQHFKVPISEGTELLQDLRAELPGYAIPTYVQEIPHKTSKTPLLTNP